MGDFPSAGCALDETFFNEERLVHFFDSFRIFAEGSGNCSQTDRAAVELVYDGGQNLVVDFVKPVAVNVEGLEGIAGDFGVNPSGAFHLCKVAYAAEKGVCYTGRTAAAHGDFSGCFARAFHVVRNVLPDLCQS